MDWIDVTIGVIGGGASIIGAIISCRQSREAGKAKKASEAARDATEEARDRFFQNIQYEEFTAFLKECEKFERFLHRASKDNDIQGKSDSYVEDELEKFVTKFNVVISKTSGSDRDDLMERYEALASKRNTVKAGNRDNILALLDEARDLARKIADIQMSNKMRV